MTTSSVEIFFTGCGPTGIPRPSSDTEQDPSALSVIMMFLQYPASASSIELSTTSWIR